MSLLNNRVGRALAVRGVDYVRPKIRSNTLRRGLHVRKTTGKSLYGVAIPHFWAAIFHDGRGTVRPVNSPILVWFKDRNRDPRLDGGHTQERLSQVRRLDPGTVRGLLRERNQKISDYKKRTGKRTLTASDMRALDLPIIIAKRSPRGGSGRVAGTNFFLNTPGGGMAGFKEVADKIALEVTDKFVVNSFKKSKLWKKRTPILLRM